MNRIIPLLLFSITTSFGQSVKTDSLWSPLKYFVGEWKGEGGGEPGIGKYERHYSFILNNNFIEIKNKSTYPPTSKKPKGEIHEDIGYFIYDKGRKTFLLRQLHVEGFVNDYVLDHLSADKKSMVFISDLLINIPKGYRARETYTMVNINEFEETFELAEPDKDFTLYSKVRFVRSGKNK